MTTSEYIQFVLEVKAEASPAHAVDEAAANEVAQLVSGSFTYPLYEALWVRAFDLDAISQHLESLHDTENHIGFVYFIFMLANAAELIVPAQFSEMSAKDSLVSFLAAAIMEDWLEYHTTHEVTESE